MGIFTACSTDFGRDRGLGFVIKDRCRDCNGGGVGTHRLSLGDSRLSTFGLTANRVAILRNDVGRSTALKFFKHLGCSCRNQCLMRLSKHASNSSHFTQKRH